MNFKKLVILISILVSTSIFIGITGFVIDYGIFKYINYFILLLLASISPFLFLKYKFENELIIRELEISRNQSYFLAQRVSFLSNENRDCMEIIQELENENRILMTIPNGKRVN